MEDQNKSKPTVNQLQEWYHTNYKYFHEIADWYNEFDNDYYKKIIEPFIRKKEKKVKYKSIFIVSLILLPFFVFIIVAGIVNMQRNESDYKSDYNHKNEIVENLTSSECFSSFKGWTEKELVSFFGKKPILIDVSDTWMDKDYMYFNKVLTFKNITCDNGTKKADYVTFTLDKSGVVKCDVKNLDN